MKRCFQCMKQYEDIYNICPYCGYDENSAPKVEYHLRPGVVVNERYVIGVTLGYGGFGITYKAWDRKLATTVAIKEFFPSHLVSRIPGTEKVNLQGQSKAALYASEKKKFLLEAQMIAKFRAHPNIVHVSDFFELNETAYMVMEYLDGLDLLQYVKNQPDKRMSAEELIPLILEICKALKQIHESGIIHRDIAPDNIKITSDGRVKLLDFGAARATSDKEFNAFTVVVKPGYAPPEQYMKTSKSGPWTDIYALCATMYRVLTGKKPVEASDRRSEECLVKPRELNPDIPMWLEQVILRGMAIEPENRFRNVKQLEAALVQKKEVQPPEEIKKRKSYRKIIGFTVAVLVCAAAILFIMPKNEGLSDKGIKDGAIVVDVPDTEYSRSAFGLAKEKFETSFPGKKVELNFVKNGSLAVCDGSHVDDGLHEAIDLTELYKDLEIDDYYFLGKYERELKKELPLSSNFYVLVYNKYLVKRTPEIRNLLEVPATETVDVVELGEEVLTDKSLFVSEIGVEGITEKTADATEKFCHEKCAMVVTTTNELPKIQKEMPGYYEVLPMSIGKAQYGTFDYNFRICEKCENNTKKIAELWLNYLVSDEGQSILFIQNTGGVPLKKSTFEEYIEIYSNLKIIENQLDKTELIK